METMKTILFAIHTLHVLGFKPATTEADEPTKLLYHFPAKDLLAVHITEDHLQMTWQKDSNNFDLIPFNVAGVDNDELVSMDHFVQILQDYVEKVSK